ncbi:MAG: single-stranded DNA-binding protein [Fibrobacter sp.]|nr:single-stranded DNA-binding protein [Fibrobacter sp.]
MPNYNKITIIGHVGHTPQAKATPSGTIFTSFPVAVSEYRKKQDGTFDERTTWFDCICYDKFLADKITRGGVQRGDAVMVSGTVSCSAFAGKDGSPKAKMSVNVKDFILVSRKTGTGANVANNGTNNQNAYTYQAANNVDAQSQDSGYESGIDDDLPF